MSMYVFGKIEIEQKSSKKWAKERAHFALPNLAKGRHNSCKRARPVSASKGERWRSPYVVQTSLLGVDAAHLFDALLLVFIEKHKYVSIESIEHICRVLNCGVDDILEFVPDKQ